MYSNNLSVTPFYYEYYLMKEKLTREGKKSIERKEITFSCKLSPFKNLSIINHEHETF